MNEVSILLGLCCLISLVHGRQILSNVGQDNMTNVVVLTANNVDKEIAYKDHFVLFYVAG